MKISAIGPNIVVPSPTEKPERKKEELQVKKVADSESSSETPLLSDEEKQKIVSIFAKARNFQKKQDRQKEGRKKRALAAYAKVQDAQTNELLKENFKRKM